MDLEPETNLGLLQSSFDTILSRMEGGKTASRIWRRDHTLWNPDPTEIADRLGWLDSPTTTAEQLAEIDQFVTSVRDDGFDQILLLGMGGSSLAPEVFSKIFGPHGGFPQLSVLDSTHPDAVLAATEGLDVAKTLFVAATKSGGTVETISFLRYCHQLVESRLSASPGRQFVAITDPGSGLEAIANELNFRHTFLNDPAIGGRYSALSLFGLVPAALLGIDLSLLLDRAKEMAKQCRANSGNPGLQLGAILGAAHQQGQDKLTLVMSPMLTPFAAWIEQLIAESTGKAGRGILPVEGELLLPDHTYGSDRLFVSLIAEGDSFDSPIRELAERGHPVIACRLADEYDIAAEFFRWEMATAVAGAVLGINPFDQPDVEAAKVQARSFVSAFIEEGGLPSRGSSFASGPTTVYAEAEASSLEEAIDGLLGGRLRDSRPFPYVAIQAYLPPSLEIDRALEELRSAIRNRTGLATTVGYGPRFLHSTGQLHKGDSGVGIFIQLTNDCGKDATIPGEETQGRSLSFGTLIAAQAMGDRRALLDKGRRVLAIHLGRNTSDGIAYVVRSVR